MDGGREMLAIVDIETMGLDARRFVTACLLKENGKKRHFYNKESLWKYIIDLGLKEMKRGKVLNLYGHNHEFDFYGYADLSDEHLRFVSFKPFIAQYKVNGKKAINFLDSYAIFNMPLKALGEIMGYEKFDTPEDFKTGKEVSLERVKELEYYVERDVEVVMKAIKLLKYKMNLEGVNLRRLYTINQIAIMYLINKIKKLDKYDELFWDKRKGVLYPSRYDEMVHEAYRGGRCECFKLGFFKEVDYIDINNLYGYSSMNIKFPNLRKEQLIKEPLKVFDRDSLLRNIGISKVLIYNKRNKLGLLPIRTDTGNYYPKENTYLLGTYTHIELEEALKEGYELIDIEWSIIWEEMENPFKEITPRLYELRKRAENKFDNWFYKEMQNRSYGKMGQRRNGQEYIIDSVDKAEEYLRKSYEIMRGEGYNYTYKRNNDEVRKSYYAPIIPTLINAYARIYMYRQFKKIKEGDLLYTDTDSCIMKKGNLKPFEITNNLGEFKLVAENSDLIIKGRKTYAIGDEVKIAGFRKRDLTIEDFKKGIVKSMKMITMKTAKDIKDVGGFYEETRDLNVQQEESENLHKIYKNELMFRDNNIKNIDYFEEKIVEIADKSKSKDI